MKADGYWGKTNDGAFHRLSYHALDVVACATRLIERSDRLARSLCHHIHLSRSELTSLIGWAAALHDLGKLSPAFQHQDSQTSAIATGLGVAKVAQGYDVRHDSLGWELWQEVSGPMFDDSVIDAADAIMRCATGHHGKPPTNVKNGTRIQCHRYFTEADLASGREWIDWATNHFKPAFPDAKSVESASWWIAGVITLADWLGSNLEWFPYCEDVIEPDAYLSRAVLQADRAIADSGVVMPLARRNFADLFPGYIPTPMQSAVLELPLDDRPFLLVIEETTGGGKTEAALAAASGSSLFFGLPTMATANGLWRRVGAIGGQQALIHGKRWFMPDSMDRASAWLNDNGRKALLADIGVGTIDQAMIGAMYARYGVLRLAGLAGKTLIVDEVHAYDEYMKRIIEVLIEMHARSGGSVILLSATLPLAHRQDYAAAWCRGMRLPAPVLTKSAFPLISFIDHGWTIIEKDNIKSRYQEDDVAGRTIQVQHSSSADDVLHRIIKEADGGKCVAWIRNTVGEAIEAFETLKTMGVAVELFHSRFVAGDRADIESRVIDTFGKAGTEQGRRGRILVATQVIEQSLDLDFDFMVTDLCPVDLLIQRAGRLHRHDRGNRGTPVLLIHAPAWVDDPSPGWISDWSRGTAWVYGNHGALWNTMHLIADGFTLPSDSRKLVEGVFANAVIPAGLSKISSTHTGKQLAQSMQGAMSAINPRLPYQAEGLPMWDDITAPTRLGEPVSEWVVFETGKPITGDLATSTIQLRQSQVQAAPDAGVRVGKWQRSMNLVGGQAECIGWKGPVTVVYDRERGLVVKEA